MIEIERQLSEAPDICAIVRGNPVHGLVWVERFEDENGGIIAEMGETEYAELYLRYRDEIGGALDDCREEMQKTFEQYESD